MRKFGYVKQHLLRNHGSEFMCQRCAEDFGSESLLRRHVSASEPCEYREAPADGKMKSATQDAVKNIRSRKGAGGQALSDEDRWFEVYSILFPNEPLPVSPYAGSPAVEVLRAFNASMTQDTGRQVLEQVFGPEASDRKSIELVDKIVSTFINLKLDNAVLTSGSKNALPSVTNRSNSSPTAFAGGRSDMWPPEGQMPDVDNDLDQMPSWENLVSGSCNGESLHLPGGIPGYSDCYISQDPEEPQDTLDCGIPMDDFLSFGSSGGYIQQ
ncbi:hypothetical protein OQA88_13669 [Cercophora sp. LCS_1]